MSFSSYKGTRFAPWLLPIIPLDAKLSDHSKLTPEHLGKIPGLMNDDGTWVGFEKWTIAKVPAGVLPRWDAWYTPPRVPTVGIAGRLFPCADIDIKDKSFAELAQGVAEDILGKTIVRGRPNSEKRLLMYQLDQPCDFVHKIRRVYKHPDTGEDMPVEVLGLGQHYLIEGMHPSGVLYEWAEGKTPLLAGAESLPKVTVAKMHEFFKELDGRMAFFGAIVVRGSRSGAGGEPGKREGIAPGGPLCAPSIEHVIDALSFLNVNMDEFADRADWEKFLRALKASVGGDEGFYDDHYLPWNLENSANDDRNIRERWEGHSDSEIGWDHISSVAGGYGYTGHLSDLFGDTEGDDAGRDPVLSAGQSAEQSSDGVVGPGNGQDGREGSGLQPSQLPLGNDPAAKYQLDAEVTIAREFVKEHARKDLIYVPGSHPLEVWREFQDGRWQVAHGGALIRCAEAGEAMAQRIRTSASVTQADRGRATFLAGKHFAENIQGLARASRQMIVTRPELDNRPLHMGVPGGYIGPDGLLHDPDPSLLLTKCALIAPAPGPCPMWEGLVFTLANEDFETFMALRSAIGYTMTGTGQEQKFFFLYGASGHNGKTTFLQILSRMLGSYSHLLPDGAFVASTRTDVKFMFGGMEGAWFVFSNEIEQGEAWATARLKDKTGSGTTYIERKGVQGFEAPIHYTLWFQGNHLPVFHKVDQSLRQRMIIFTLEHEFKKDEDEIMSFADRCIATEGPQIMRWLLEARQDYLEFGLQIPPAMLAARDEYVNGQDAMRQFIEQEIEFVPWSKPISSDTPALSSDELYSAWRDWREFDGRNVNWSGSKETFMSAFYAHELVRGKVGKGERGKGHNRRRIAVGVKFVSHDSDEVVVDHL